MALNSSETRPRNSGQYRSDREWSDLYIPTIKKLVGPHLLDVAPMEVDNLQATDLIVFTVKDKKIAARIREANKYLPKYAEQFTIRSRRDNGMMTELEKIHRGFGSWMFYGFGHDDRTIYPWYLIDLDSFRYHMRRESWYVNGIKSEEKPNGDGTHFRAFWIYSFPDDPPLLVASSNDSIDF
jgi:hypothetical protein